MMTDLWSFKLPIWDLVRLETLDGPLRSTNCISYTNTVCSFWNSGLRHWSIFAIQLVSSSLFLSRWSLNVRASWMPTDTSWYTEFLWPFCMYSSVVIIQFLPWTVPRCRRQWHVFGLGSACSVHLRQSIGNATSSACPFMVWCLRIWIVWIFSRASLSDLRIYVTQSAVRSLVGVVS